MPLVTVSAADPGAPSCAGILEVGIREADGQGYDADVWATTEAGPYVTSFSHIFTLPITGVVDGKRTWTCWARDASKPFAGALANSITVYLNIDTQPPVTESDADASWHNTPVTVHFSASDPDSPNHTGSSGVTEIECALDGAALAVGTSLGVPAPADHSGDGVHQISYLSADGAGNTDPTRTGPVKIDTTAPQTTDDADAAWHTTAVTVHFTATDPKPTVGAPLVSDSSGVAVTRYSLDGTSWQSGASATIPVPSGGVISQTVQYFSEDAAGNKEAVKRCVVKINTAPPTTIVSGLPDGWVNHDVTLGFSATPGPSGSPVTLTELSTDGVTWTKGTTLTIVAAADPLGRWRPQRGVSLRRRGRPRGAHQELRGAHRHHSGRAAGAGRGRSEEGRQGDLQVPCRRHGRDDAAEPHGDGQAAHQATAERGPEAGQDVEAW